MSNFNLAKELLPSKKAWKNLKNKLQFKSRTSKLVRAIDTLKHRFLVVYRSVTPLIYNKFRAFTNSRLPRSHHYQHQHFHQSLSAIYVDELFQGNSILLAENIKLKENTVASSGSASSSSSYVNKETPIEIERVRPVNHEKSVASGKAKADGEINSKKSSAADKWKIPLLPQFKGIDERAEEFIARFRQDMKLQREQSILDFQEMLKRSA